MRLDEPLGQRMHWITLTATLDETGVRFERDWMRRTYWGDHPGAPWQPPPAGAEVEPSDFSWWRALVIGERRRQDDLPPWAARIPAPDNPLDYDAPLPPRMAALASQEPWSRHLGWLLDRLQTFAVGFDLADPDSGHRDVILENVPIEFWEELQDETATMLVPIYQGLLDKPWPGDLPRPTTGTISSLQPPSGSAAEDALVEVTDALYDLVAEVLDSRIRPTG